MFLYRPPKSSCWGHVIRPKGLPMVNAFFDTFFERAEPDRDRTRVFSWKDSILPNTDWPEPFSRQIVIFVNGDRLMFPLGLVFPISPGEPASYEFLRGFCAEAPFKMSSKHFLVGVIGKTGKLAWRKPDADAAARLQQTIV
jgi:hypothetical protein